MARANDMQAAAALPVGSFFVQVDSSPSSSSAPAPTPASSLLDKVHRLSLQLSLVTESISAVRSPASLADVDGRVFRVSIVPDRDATAAVAAPSNRKGKGKAQLKQAGKERGALLADVLAGLCRSAALWHGEVALDVDGSLLGAEPVLDPTLAWDGRTLPQLYSLLPSPSPTTVAPFARVGSPAHQAFTQILADVDEDLPGMKTRLYGFQATDVKQMVLCELASPPLMDIEFAVLRAVPVDGLQPAPEYYVSLVRGLVRSTVDRFAAPAGGILCEEMGFGKTVCVLALILATKAQRAAAPVGAQTHTRWRNPPPRDDGAAHRVPALRDLSAHALLATPFGGLHPSTLDDPDALSPGARDVLNAIDFRAQRPVYWAAKKTRGRTGANDSAMAVEISLGWASLVLVPDNLFLQWKDMLAEHVEPGALRALVVEGNDELPSAAILATEYDLVLMSHGRFARESQRGSFSSTATDSRPCHCYAGGRTCSCDASTSPLVRVRWKRLVVDEGHVASSKTSNLVRLASELPAERVWCVTGTPTPNLVGLSAAGSVERVAQAWPAQSKDDLARLQTLCKFLKVGSLSSFIEVSSFGLEDGSLFGTHWNNLVAAPLHMGMTQAPDAGAVQRLDTLLQRIMIRHRPEDRTDAALPPLHISSVSVAPSPLTTTTINVLLAIMVLNSLTTGRSGENWLFSKASSGSLQRLFSNLSYSAFWLSSPTFFDLVAKQWAVQTEVEETDSGNRAYGQEDLELLESTHRHLQRGSDPIWQHVVGSYGASLPARIRGLDDELALAWGASKPDGWDDHLMQPAKLVRLRKLAVAYLSSSPDVESPDLVGYLVSEGKVAQAAEARAAKHLEQVASGKGVSQAWWNTEAQAEADRMSKPKNRSLAVAKDPFPSPPPAPADFPLLQARVVTTASSKLNHVVAQVLRYGESEKTLVFSRDASALGLLIEMLDLVGVPADFVGGIMSRAKRQKTVASFETGERTRVLLIELNQGARGLNISSASRVLFCEPVLSADVNMQALKRAHRVSQTKDVYVETLVASGTFEEEIVSQQQPAKKPKATVSKGLPPEQRVHDLLQDTSFLPTDVPPAPNDPAFDVPFWLSGTYHETMEKLRSGHGPSRPQALAPLANKTLRSLAPTRRADEGAQRRTATQADLPRTLENGQKRVRVA